VPAAKRSRSSTARRKSTGAKRSTSSSATKAKPSPRGVDTVRRAVERTVHSTLGSAGLTRDRAQEVVDEVVNRGQQTAARAGRGVRDAGQRQAEAAAGVSDRLREALHDLRVITTDEMKDLRSTIERLANQVESLESRVSAATGLRRPGSTASPASRKKATTKTTKKSSRKSAATKRSASAKKAGDAKKRAAKKRAPSAKKAAKRSSTKARARAAPRRSSPSRSR
jgi:polyhydroxyalkanoate synthesis regulator phasin